MFSSTLVGCFLKLQFMLEVRYSLREFISRRNVESRSVRQLNVIQQFFVLFELIVAQAETLVMVETKIAVRIPVFVLAILKWILKQVTMAILIKALSRALLQTPFRTLLLIRFLPLLHFLTLILVLIITLVHVLILLFLLK